MRHCAPARTDLEPHPAGAHNFLGVPNKDILLIFALQKKASKEVYNKKHTTIDE